MSDLGQLSQLDGSSLNYNVQPSPIPAPMESRAVIRTTAPAGNARVNANLVSRNVRLCQEMSGVPIIKYAKRTHRILAKKCHTFSGQ